MVELINLSNLSGKATNLLTPAFQMLSLFYIVVNETSVFSFQPLVEQNEQFEDVALTSRKVKWAFFIVHLTDKILNPLIKKIIILIFEPTFQCVE